MTKSQEYDQIIEETLPQGFRLSREEADCENGMPAELCEFYENLAGKSESELEKLARKGTLFPGV